MKRKTWRLKSKFDACIIYSCGRIECFKNCALFSSLKSSTIYMRATLTKIPRLFNTDFL